MFCSEDHLSAGLVRERLQITCGRLKTINGFQLEFRVKMVCLVTGSLGVISNTNGVNTRGHYNTNKTLKRVYDV